MKTLTRDTILMKANISTQTCCICSFDDLGVSAIWSEQQKLLKAYNVLRDFSSNLHVCFECIEQFIAEEGGKLKKQSDLMYLFPELIHEVCDDEKSSFSYVTPDIIGHARMLRQLDNDIKNARLEPETVSAWWQGATGDDLSLYKKLIVDICTSPEQFIDTDVASYVKSKCNIAADIPLSPAIHVAEQFRQSHLKLMMARRETCSFLRLVDRFQSL